MAQTIEFKCKGKDDKGKPCKEKVFYPSVEDIVVYKMREEPKAPVIPGQIMQTYLTCAKNHCLPYNVVEFNCEGPGCGEVVVATTETAPVYEGDIRVEKGKVKLTCDHKPDKHTRTYEIVG